jgi:hypothetical protein
VGLMRGTVIQLGLVRVELGGERGACVGLMVGRCSKCVCVCADSLWSELDFLCDTCCLDIGFWGR